MASPSPCEANPQPLPASLELSQLEKTFTKAFEISDEHGQLSLGAAFDKVLEAEHSRNVTQHTADWQSHMRQAGMGRKETAWGNTAARSDSLLWVTPLYDAWLSGTPLPSDLSGLNIPATTLEPAFHAFKTAQAALRDSNPYLALSDKLSIQLARYPSNSAGYHEHCDAFRPTGAERSVRQITLLLYLNQEWEAAHGGELGLTACQPALVQPLGGRLVVFDSHRVLHRVHPTGAAPRWALTCWLYGDGPFRGSDSPDLSANIPLPRVLPAAAPPTHDHPSIFVNIPAYRDPQLRATVWDLLSTAEHPQRVFIGMVQQLDLALTDDGSCVDEGLDISCDLAAVRRGGAKVSHPALLRAVPYMTHHHVRVMTVPSTSAAGPCWARHLAQSLSHGEQYTLFLDSHMRMPHKWDSTLVTQLAAAEVLAAPVPSAEPHSSHTGAASDPPPCSDAPAARTLQCGKPAVVLSAYPAGYTVSDGTSPPVGGARPPGYAYTVPRVAVTAPMRMQVSAPSAAFTGETAVPPAAQGTGGTCSDVPADRWPRFKGCYARIPPAYMREAVKLDGTGSLRGVLRGSAPPFPATCCAAGLSFARTATWQAVQRTVGAPALGDPGMRHMFFGEEALMALRLRRAGVAIFAPGVPVAWHLWSREGRSGFRADAAGVLSDQLQAAIRSQRAASEAAAWAEFAAHAPSEYPELVAQVEGGASSSHSVLVGSIANAAVACCSPSDWALPAQLLMLGGAMKASSPGADAAQKGPAAGAKGAV